MASSVSPEQIWSALETAGATAVQAAGIMGNWIAESSLNPEAVNPADSNGYPSYGLSQWNTASYPSAATLVTGNPVNDLTAQVTFFFQTVPQSALTGATPAAVASNIAANYERCSSCQSGGSQNTSRQANAVQVASWASSGNWPSTSGQASDTAVLTAAQAQAQQQGEASCAWAIGWGGIPGTSWLSWLKSLGGSSGNIGAGQVCILSNDQVRVMLGVAVGALGLLVTGFGVSMALRAAGVYAAVWERIRHPIESLAGTEPGGPAAAPAGAAAGGAAAGQAAGGEAAGGAEAGDAAAAAALAA